LEVLLHRILRPWLRPEWLWKLTAQGHRETVLLKTLHGFTEQVVAERKQERKENKAVSGRNNFLNLILDVAEKGGLTDSDIREQTDTFTFGGHDTSASSIATTLFFLANNPTCQEKVLGEVLRVTGGHIESDFTMAQLLEMKYLESCIKESLRIFPPVPFMTRRIEEDLTLDDGRVIPAGTDAFLSPYFLHRDESVFPDAENFYPERFSAETSTGRNPYAYIPFSAGPRNCIGKFQEFLFQIVFNEFGTNSRPAIRLFGA